MKRRIAVVVAALAASASGCQPELDTSRTVDSYASFGDAIYRETCQRVAYTGQLAQQAAGQIQQVDVSGTLGRDVCVAGDAPPDGAPAPLFALAGEHPELTSTVDTILPQPFLATLEQYLENILPLYDDGTMPDAIGGLARLLGEMHDDPDVPVALARIRARHGYTPAAPGLIHDVLAYPQIDGFIGSFLGLIGPGGAAEPQWKSLLAAGAVAATTAQPEINAAASDRTLNLTLDLLLNHSDPDLGSGSPHWTVVRDVRGMAKVALDSDGQVMAPFVDTDHDGLADIDAAGHFVDALGAPLAAPSPFPELGVSDSAPRDGNGRALTASGASTTLYQYLDLDQTVLAGLLREAPTLLDPSKDTTLGLAWGATALLGPRAMQTRTYSTTSGVPIASVVYNGFDLDQSAALDLLHSLVQLLGAPSIDQVLQATRTLLAQQESASSRVIGAMLDTSDRGKQHPEAQIPTTSTLYDDLAPIIARTLRVKGLPAALLTALNDPHVQGLAPMIARMMAAKDQVDFNHTNAAIGSALGAPSYDVVGNLDNPTPVDRTQLDSDYNRSLMQRIAHLVHDSSGLSLCNKDNASTFGLTFARCKLFQIPDLAMFFALNMASPAVKMNPARAATTYNVASFREQVTDPSIKGLIADSAVGDNTLEHTLTKIDGFTRFPTPKALTRALFLRTTDSGESAFLASTMDPVVCVDGDRFIDVHDKSLAAWEMALPGNPSGFANDTFYDAVQPLIDAFASYDECVEVAADGSCSKAQNAVKIFVDLLSVLHEHWASPQSTYFGHGFQSTSRSQPRYSAGDSVVSFEPLVTEVLRADLVPSLLAIAPVLTDLQLDDGALALPVLVAALQYVFDPQVTPAGLAYRSGQTTAVESDGVTPVARATPYYLIADGFAEKRAVLASIATDPDGAIQSAKWKAATSALVDQVLTVDQTSPTRWQFHNRRFHAITQALISFVRGRVTAHAAAGDLDRWVHQDLTGDLTDKLTGPVFAALGDLAGAIEHDDAGRAQFYGLLLYLIDEAGHDAVFRNALALFADQAQQFVSDRDMVPIAHVIGNALDPVQNIANAEIALVKRSHDLDTDQALLTILRAMFEPDPTSGVEPASNLADLVTTVDRSTPGQTGDLDAGDEAGTLAGLRDFFGDNQRGFLRFVAIVHNRNGQ